MPARCGGIALLAVIFLAVCSPNANAQTPYWEVVGSEGDTLGGGEINLAGDLYIAARRIDDSSLVVVGGRGKVLRSDDRGVHWRHQLSNSVEDLNAVHFCDAKHGMAVGEHGAMLSTTDGGTSWTVRAAGVSIALKGVFMTDPDHAVAVGEGGTILATGNGGAVWVQQHSNTLRSLNDVCFLDASNGFVVGNAGIVLLTTNGGETWNVFDAQAAVDLWRVRFVQGRFGVIAGDFGTLLATSNAGAAWSPLPIGTDEPLRGADILDSSNITAVSARTIFTTHDAGANWIYRDPHETPGIDKSINVSDVAMTTVSDRIVVGGQNSLLSTGDSGVTWKLGAYMPLLDGISARGLINIQFTEFGDGFILGRNSIFKSADRGATWMHTPISAQLAGVHFFSRDSGIAAGSGLIFFTADGGKTWSLQSGSPRTSVLDFPDRYVGYGVGDSVLSHTSDGGLTWQSIRYATIDAFHAIHFINDSIGIAVVAQFQMPRFVGRILRTENRGATWDTVAANDSLQWTDMAFADSAVGLVVGLKGSIMRTTDAGKTWHEVGTSRTKVFNGVSFLNGNVAYVTGQGPEMLVTTDRGATWSTTSLGSPYTRIPSLTIRRLCRSGQDTTFLVGSGTVLRRIGPVDVVSGVTRTVPAGNVALSSLRAYPNPSRDRLTIDLDCSGAAHHITLQCYDATGNECSGRLTVLAVRETSNGLQYAFDASELPAGWYLLVARSADRLLGSCSIIQE